MVSSRALTFFLSSSFSILTSLFMFSSALMRLFMPSDILKMMMTVKITKKNRMAARTSKFMLGPLNVRASRSDRSRSFPTALADGRCAMRLPSVPLGQFQNK